MEILLTIPAFFVFLFCIYKLVKDDYVFIRRNISLEQVFDITIIIFLICLAFISFSLISALIVGIICLYAFVKYKKIPLGRAFDFFTFALSVALPVGFLSHAFFVKGSDLILYLINVGLYLIFAIFSGKVVYPMLMSRELKEGSLYIIFLIFFSFVSLVDVAFLLFKGKLILYSVPNLLLILLFIFSLFLFFKQARSGFTNKKRT